MLADGPLEKDFAIVKLPSFHQAQLFFPARMQKVKNGCWAFFLNWLWGVCSAKKKAPVKATFTGAQAAENPPESASGPKPFRAFNRTRRHVRRGRGGSCVVKAHFPEQKPPGVAAAGELAFPSASLSKQAESP